MISCTTRPGLLKRPIFRSSSRRFSSGVCVATFQLPRFVICLLSIFAPAYSIVIFYFVLYVINTCGVHLWLPLCFGMLSFSFDCMPLHVCVGYARVVSVWYHLCYFLFFGISFHCIYSSLRSCMYAITAITNKQKKSRLQRT